MAIRIHQIEGAAIEQVIAVLLQAEHSERALRWGLRNLADAVYRMDDDHHLLGAATMQWRADPCEIGELAIVPERHGQGLGRMLVEWLCDEARRRGYRAILVGTSNASIGNLAFYQKIGFRMDHIRQDYFGYYRQPLFENGIQVRDMVVFRRELQSS